MALTGLTVTDMQIFAFVGPARAGKTTASNYLEEECKERGYYTQRLSFAGPIKEGCARLGITKEKDHDEYRELAQRWGKGRRERNPNHYIRKMGRALQRCALVEKSDYALLDKQRNLCCWSETVVIIDDVRYENEVAALHELGAHIVLVHPGESRIDFSEEWRQHESESLANKICQDEDELEYFNDLYDGWEVPADSGEEMMQRVIGIFCDKLWFDSTFPYTQD